MTVTITSCCYRHNTQDKPTKKLQLDDDRIGMETKTAAVCKLDIKNLGGNMKRLETRQQYETCF